MKTKKLSLGVLHFVLALLSVAAFTSPVCGQIFVLSTPNSTNAVITTYNTSGATSALIQLPTTADNFGNGSITYDGSGRIFAGSGNNVGEYTVSGAVLNSSLISSLNDVFGLAVDGGHLFVIWETQQYVPYIGEFSTNGTPINASLINLDGKNCVSLKGDGAGHLFLLTGNTIEEYSTSGAGLYLPLLSLPSYCSAFAVDNNGYIYVANGNGDTTTISKYTTSGTLVNASLISGLPSVFVSDMTLDGRGNLYLQIWTPSWLGSPGNYVAEYTTTGQLINASLISGLQDFPNSIVFIPTAQPPAINTQPQDALVTANGSASFSVIANGATPLSYQWTLNGLSILNATNSSVAIDNVTQTNLGAYTVIVANNSGSVTSSIANLTMYPYLEIPFTGEKINWGDNGTLSITAWGTGPLAYQWYRNGIAIPNATNQTFALSDCQFTNAGLYHVVVTSPFGSVTNTPAQVVVQPTQPFLNITISLTLSKQSSNSVVGTVSTTTSPIILKMTAANLLNVLAFDENLEGNWPSNSFPKNTTLALVDNTFFAINGTNILLNVSDIMSYNLGEPQVNSGKRNTVTGLASTSAQKLQMANIIFDDTFISGGNNLHFYLYGVFAKTTTDTTPVNGVYTETQTIKSTTVLGDGFLQDVPFTCTGTFSATGKGSLHL